MGLMKNMAIRSGRQQNKKLYLPKKKHGNEAVCILDRLIARTKQLDLKREKKRQNIKKRRRARKIQQKNDLFFACSPYTKKYNYFRKRTENDRELFRSCKNRYLSKSLKILAK